MTDLEKLLQQAEKEDKENPVERTCNIDDDHCENCGS